MSAAGTRMIRKTPVILDITASIYAVRFMLLLQRYTVDTRGPSRQGGGSVCRRVPRKVALLTSPREDQARREIRLLRRRAHRRPQGQEVRARGRAPGLHPRPGGAQRAGGGRDG